MSGFGKVFGIFGARTADSAPTLPLPLRSRKRANERAPASERISEREPIPSAAPRRHEGAHVARLDRGERLQRDLFAGVFGEKPEELAHVALIGLDGLRRHAPLGAKMREPAPQLRRDVGGGELQRVVFSHDIDISSRLILRRGLVRRHLGAMDPRVMPRA